MDNQLSNNDPDLKRAREIRKARSEQRPLDASEDDVLNRLREYKTQKHKKTASLTSRKEKVWESISSETAADSNTPVSFLDNRPITKWAAAAVLIIGAVVGILYTQFNTQSQLVATSEQSIKNVTLGDGTKVKLRPHSKLYKLEASNTKRNYRIKGEGFFDVTHDAEHPFSVVTATGKVRVLGTRFILSSWGKQLNVYLEKGSVSVRALKQDSAVVLDPGESASVTDQTKVPVKQRAVVKEFTDWMNEQLVFENRTAKHIAAELEQQFNVTINLSQEVGNLKLTGTLSLNNLQSALDDLELVLNGNFEKQDDHQYRFKMQTN